MGSKILTDCPAGTTMKSGHNRKSNRVNNLNKLTNQKKKEFLERHQLLKQTGKENFNSPILIKNSIYNKKSPYKEKRSPRQLHL